MFGSLNKQNINLNCPIIWRIQNLQRGRLKLYPKAETFWTLPQLSGDLSRATLQTFSEDEYEFTKQQEAVFLKLENSMRDCANLLAIRSFSDLFAAFVMFLQGDQLEVYIGGANFVNAVVLALLVRWGAPNFQLICGTEGQDIHHLLKGLDKMTATFEEFALISGVLAVLQFTAAAVQWPATTVFVALVSAILTGFRISIMLHVNLKFWWKEFLDKTLHCNPVQPEDESEAELVRSMSSEQQQYEFSHKQEQVFRDLVDAMHVCGLGLLVLTLSDVLIIVARIYSNKLAPAVATFFNTLDDVVVAILIFRASRRFDKIIRTVGSDISLLLEGLGSNVGLCLLFKQIGQVAIFLAIGQFIQNSAILTSQVLSRAQFAPYIVETFNDSVDVVLGIISTIM